MNSNLSSSIRKDTNEPQSALKAPPGVNVIHIVYIILGIIGTLVLFCWLFIITEIGWAKWLSGAFYTSLIWLIVHGISKIKSWVVELIQIYSAFSLIRLFFDFTTLKPENAVGIFGKLFVIFLIIFYFYQIIVFSRTETKKYFKNSGSNLFV